MWTTLHGAGWSEGYLQLCLVLLALCFTLSTGRITSLEDTADTALIAATRNSADLEIVKRHIGL